VTDTFFRLDALVQAGLEAVEQTGRYPGCRADIPRMPKTIACLARHCRADEPAACQAMRAQAPGLEAVNRPIDPGPESARGRP
jgi:hypothetical protein